MKNEIFTFVNMKPLLNSNGFFRTYSNIKLDIIQGRYFPYSHLKPVLNYLSKSFKVEQIGTSFLEIPIHCVEIGSGPLKIFGWSQMHGNETTSTKGLLDFINFLSVHRADSEVMQILSSCTFKFIPMLNPDGAARYTRENVNGIDLNRDAQQLHEKESRILRRSFDEFNPDFCLNLHDQRTIFGVGGSAKSATMSFLAPAMDEELSISESRKVAMQVIAGINNQLQKTILGHVGRYDDAFNLNCVGDTFQEKRTPTILFEAGHFPKDYLREETRKIFCFALYEAVKLITNGSYKKFTVEDYHDIPENQKTFYDLILRNASVNNEKVDLAFQYEEKMRGGEVHFEPAFKTMAPNLSLRGHSEIDCKGGLVEPIVGSGFFENDIVRLVLLNKEKLSIESQDIQ